MFRLLFSRGLRTDDWPKIAVLPAPGAVPVLRDLGLLLFEMGDYERAGKTFRSLLLQRDTSGSITKAEVFYYLGEISHRQNDKAKAIQMLERSIEADGSFQKARELLAQLKG